MSKSSQPDNADRSTLVEQLTKLAPETLVDTILQAVKSLGDKGEAIRQALVVRLINLRPTHTMGEQYVDTLDDRNDQQRLTYQIAPFARPTGGAVVVCIAKNEHGEDCVLLAHNKGVKNWQLPGGFMTAIAARSALGVQAHDTPEREKYEQYIRSSQAKVPAPVSAVQTLSKETPQFDDSLKAVAQRELQEETGLTPTPSQFKQVYNFTHTVRSNANGDNHPFQQICNAYVVDLRKEGKLPDIKPSSDVAELEWIPLKKLKVDGQTVQTDATQPYQAPTEHRTITFGENTIKQNAQPPHDHGELVLRTLDFLQREAIVSKYRSGTPFEGIQL